MLCYDLIHYTGPCLVPLSLINPKPCWLLLVDGGPHLRLIGFTIQL